MMKAPKLCALALLSFVAFCLTPSVTASPVASQDVDDVMQFKKDFERAMQLNNLEEMTDLVKSNHEEALLTVIETCEAIGAQTSEKLEKRIDALRRAWQRAHDERFVDNMYEYLALMRASFRKHRSDLKVAMESNRRAFFRAAEAESEHSFPGLAVEFTSLAKAFDEIGDLYHTAECWRFAAFCNEETYVGDDAKFEVVYDYLTRFIAARNALDLRDSAYNALKARHEALALAGYSGEEVEAEAAEASGDDTARGGERGKGPAPAGGKAGAPSGPEQPTLTAEMSFELVDDVYEFERPAYHADELFPMWAVLGLGERGATTTVWTLRESPQLIRDGELAVSIDLDGDGEGDQEIPLTGNVEAVEIPLGHGSDQRGWGMLVAIANDKQIYQGITYNLAPVSSYINLYVFNAASVVGDLGGTDLRIFDDNMDGDYGSYGKSWDLVGLAEGNFHPQMDSMIVGRGKKAVPYSEYVQIDDTWYKLEPKRNGMEIHAVPQAKMKTGRLAVDVKGVKPDYLVVQGTGKWENCYFDLTEGGSKGLEVPAGEYKLFAGRIAKGKRNQMMKSVILPGQSEAIEVEEGESAELQIGAPYTFDFAYTADGENVTVQGSSVVVRGRGGEVYDRIWNAVTRPDVTLRKKGKKKGGKGKRMRVVENQVDEAVAAAGLGAMWRPLDYVTEQTDEEVEVQLYEKKNKLFGTIESEWR